MFNFGKNWLNYSKTVKNEDLETMKESLVNLIGLENIKDKTFLDIGCGSGLFSIAAKKLGAGKVIGIDILPDSIKSSEENKKKFDVQDISFERLSILDDKIKNLGRFDVVYAWGSLHHAGEMWKAIENTIHCVENNGLLVLAIYNKHWTSKFWWNIKKIYNCKNRIIKKIIELWYFIFIVPVKFVLFMKEYLKDRRGMNVYHNAIDWLGGFPYEYAAKKEIVLFLKKKNFRIIKYIPARGSTGCNEFVFKKRKN